ncbi:hypothetical protein LIER_19667 [Lithospermum erythrorhizon]|uniref:Uncharacterized protein n=1 Tax=Lithospermum erythrorhizon TaxID=34254 RepID=A0AAV3QMD5_LITER
MGRTKQTIKRFSPPSKRAKAVAGVKYACPSPPAFPSTSARPVTGRLYFSCPMRWPHTSVLADPRLAGGVSPGAFQGGRLGAGAARPPGSG